MIEILVILIFIPLLWLVAVWQMLWCTWGGRALLAVAAFCFLGFVVETLWRAVFPKRKPPGRK